MASVMGPLIASGVASGARQCHSNTCPVGVCAPRTRKLRQVLRPPERWSIHLASSPKKLRNPGEPGIRSLNEVIGRTELLNRSKWGADPGRSGFNPISPGGAEDQARYCTLRAGTRSRYTGRNR